MSGFDEVASALTHIALSYRFAILHLHLTPGQQHATASCMSEWNLVYGRALDTQRSRCERESSKILSDTV